MRPSKYSDDQIRQAIVRVADGVPLVAMCRTMGVTQTTFYRWRKKYGDGRATEANETRALRDENHRLKQLVADLYLEQQVLQASITKHTQADRRARG
ncbi:MAG: transposase [Gemmatimonadaceae bacterium]